jgi:hypothetical protein
MANIKEFKYKLIKNFFSKEELTLFKKYCLNKLDEDCFNECHVRIKTL